MSPRAIRGGHGVDIGDPSVEQFDRPRKRTRPRTKNRPDYSDAEVGRVITVDRGRYHLNVDERSVTAAKARQLGRKSVIVGDLVRVVGDTSGDEGTLARIVEVIDRTTVLRRTADDTDATERPIVANATQLAIVTALADPDPSVGMIDRIMVAGYEAGIHPVLILTKADLASPDTLISHYSPLDVPVMATQPGSDLTELRRLLADEVTVLVGHSGVGKSTLINTLIPDARRVTGVVNEVTGKGRHTSTSAIALRLPEFEGGGGWAIDTPGVRGFGVNHVTETGLLRAFPDLADITEACPRGCTHRATEPECALDDALAAGELDSRRLESFRRIVEAIHHPG